MDEMMNCPFCEKEIPVETNFCPYCGKKIEEKTESESQKVVEINSQSNEVDPKPEFPTDIKPAKEEVAETKHLSKSEPGPQQKTDDEIRLQYSGNIITNVFSWLAVNIELTVIAIFFLLIVFSFSAMYGWILAIACFVAVFFVVNPHTVASNDDKKS